MYFDDDNPDGFVARHATPGKHGRNTYLYMTTRRVIVIEYERNCSNNCAQCRILYTGTSHGVHLHSCTCSVNSGVLCACGVGRCRNRRGLVLVVKDTHAVHPAPMPGSCYRSCPGHTTVAGKFTVGCHDAALHACTRGTVRLCAATSWLAWELLYGHDRYAAISVSHT